MEINYFLRVCLKLWLACNKLLFDGRSDDLSSLDEGKEEFAKCIKVLPFPFFIWEELDELSYFFEKNAVDQIALYLNLIIYLLLEKRFPAEYIELMNNLYELKTFGRGGEVWNKIQSNCRGIKIDKIPISCELWTLIKPFSVSVNNFFFRGGNCCNCFGSTERLKLVLEKKPVCSTRLTFCTPPALNWENFWTNGWICDIIGRSRSSLKFLIRKI